MSASSTAAAAFSAGAVALGEMRVGLRVMVEVSHLARQETTRSILKWCVLGSSFVVNQNRRRISPSPPAPPAPPAWELFIF